ncbi:glycosyltransferase [Nodosilinea sp. FACHB-13]|uniref:glycosyltransferase n=1 Tax=Cyanophyceae TaxID=3028117 RepID=UPI0016872AD2|nr:glycosyltransferase [Nodosilinea sp. FACHB-13]
MFFSVVTPAYNRQPILEKCLRALENQVFDSALITDYELVVVDDGSTDGTIEWLQAAAAEFPHVRLVERHHQGAAAARNYGVQVAQGDTIVFVDSDVIMPPGSLQAHAQALADAYQRLGDDRVFTAGRLVNTSNFEQPTAEPVKVTDFSNAFFDTANLAIARHWLLTAGLFDTEFSQYGWEDLELGVRLKNLGVTMVKVPEAVGYHYHPPFSLDQIPKMIDQEIQRGRMGAIFYQKHPTREVRMMIQMTWLHRLLWGLLTAGGRLNERTMAPLLRWLIAQGKPRVALELARVFLNWYTVQGVYAAYSELQQQG